jgi:hypothetical protein
VIPKELSNYEIYPNSDDDHLPDHTQLAEKLNCNQLKMNKILKDLLDNIIKVFNDHPLIIKDIVHLLYVYPYIDQEDTKKNKDWVQKEREWAISIPVVLPVTPNIGDYVEIPFMRTSYSFSKDDKYSYGYVHDVRHTIRGTTQEISIFIYPHKNIYYKWEEMKNEYEEHKRWLAWLKTEKDRFWFNNSNFDWTEL